LGQVYADARVKWKKIQGDGAMATNALRNFHTTQKPGKTRGEGGCGSRPVKKSQSNETEYVKEQLLERIYVLHLKAQGEKFKILHTRDNHFI